MESWWKQTARQIFGDFGTARWRSRNWPTLFGFVQTLAGQRSLWLLDRWGRSSHRWWRFHLHGAYQHCSKTKRYPMKESRQCNTFTCSFTLTLKPTRSSCCSSATGQSPGPFCPPDICCSRSRTFPQSVSSCSTAPWAQRLMCCLPQNCNRLEAFLSHLCHLLHYNYEHGNKSSRSIDKIVMF